MQMNTIVSELEQKPYGAQAKQMIKLGLAAKSGDPAAQSILSQMAQGNDWMRQRFLFACFVSGDGERVLEATQDASGRVRSLAYRVAPYACSDSQAFKALVLGREVRRDKKMLMTLHKKGRQVVVDAYLDWLVNQPQSMDFADFLPLGSDACIRRHWQRAASQPSAQMWSRLSRYAAPFFAVYLRERLAARPDEADPVDRRLIEAYQAELAARAPNETLQLFKLMLSRKIEPGPRAWLALGRRVPDGLFDILSTHPRLCYYSLLSKSDLSSEQLAAAVRIAPLMLGDADALRARLSASDRATVAHTWATLHANDIPTWGLPFIQDIKDESLQSTAYEAWSVAARNGDGVISMHLLLSLPTPLRQKEAFRHLHIVSALATRPTQRIPYARFLSWEDARAYLTAWLGHPEGDMRSLTLSILLSIPGLCPDRTDLPPLALDLVVQRKFEQDPVRASMFEALCGWPRAVWSPSLLPPVARAIRDALDASDLSHRTATAAESLVIRLFPIDPAWAATWLATLIKERGNIQNPRLGAYLTAPDIAAAAPHLLAIARSWAARERNQSLVYLCESLGKFLPSIPGLSDVLHDHALDTPWPWGLHQAAQILWKHDRPTAERLIENVVTKRNTTENILAVAAVIHPPPLSSPLCDALQNIVLHRGTLGQDVQALNLLKNKAIGRFNDFLPALLKADRSFICLPLIHQYIHLRRQDLLHFCLDPAPVRGRFATSKTAWILPFQSHFFRWTPAQNTAYEAALLRLLNDPERDTPTALSAIVRLANLFSIPSQPLCALASTHPHPAMREKIIRSLSRLDAGQGLPTLLECLGDDRARFAIYGLRRAILGLPAARALAILQAAPRNKVTVAKEIFRLLGELRSEAAFSFLISLDSDTLHRDIRLALMRSLWDHLDREESWAVFERAISSPDWITASRLGDIPANYLTHTSDKRLSALLARVLNRPEPDARIDLLSRASTLTVRDPDRTFWAACFARLSSPYDDEVRAAATALLWRSYESDAPNLEKSLLSLCENPRSLNKFLETLLAYQIKTRNLWVLFAKAAERAILKAAPHLLSLAVKSAAAWRNDEQLAAFLLDTAANLPNQHMPYDALTASIGALSSVPTQPKNKLPDITKTLHASESPDVRRIAAAALNMDATQGRGWTQKRLERLRKLQKDTAPVVRGFAQLIFPPREMMPEEDA